MNEKKNLFDALAKAQLEINNPIKDKMGQFKNPYSSIDAMLECCREPLAKHGLTLSTSVRKEEYGYNALTTLHYGTEAYTIEMPIMVEKPSPQGFASALTYARRYSLSSLLSLPSDEDDDGERAEKESKRQSDKIHKLKDTKPSKKTIEEVENLLSQDESYKENILSYIEKKHSTRNLSDLSEEMLDKIKEKAQARINNQQEA